MDTIEHSQHNNLHFACTVYYTSTHFLRDLHSALDMSSYHS